MIKKTTDIRKTALLKEVMLIKKYIYIVSIIVVLISIYLFSSMNWKDTNSVSKGIIYKGIEIVEGFTHREYDKKVVVNKLNKPIRKCAHFTLFLILGVCIYLLLNAFHIPHRVIISIILCIVFAIIDETHQMFTLGRSSSIVDVLIDSMGSMLGIVIINRMCLLYNEE